MRKFPTFGWILAGVAAVVGFLFWRLEQLRPAERVARILSAQSAVASRIQEADVSGITSTAVESAALFAFVRPENAAVLDAALPAPTRAIHYVRVNAALINGKQSPFWQRAGAGRIEVPLPGGGGLVVTIDGSEMIGPDRFTSTGRIAGRPNSRALFAWNAGFLHASIEDAELGNFALRAATTELSQFYQIDPARVPPCGGERRPTTEMSRPRRAAGIESGSPVPVAPPTAGAGNPQRAEVHVMMLYTPAVLSTLGGADRIAAVQSAFDLAIAKVNSAFDASLITARVRLVKIAETRYDENASAPAKVQDDALTALYLEDDGKMDEIHALRDEAGADIVCLALNRLDAASSGLSFLLDSQDDLTNSRFAFSVVEYSSVAGTNVVPHEFGHVFGCAHDRENAQSGPGVFDFSYGYRFVGSDGRQYHDIMSYPPGIELGYFSNPNVFAPVPVNAPVGIAAGQPGESNTALTIERTAFATAAYRLQTQAAPSAGWLINVATRAFVGTGEEVLIGGFLVQGNAPKKMLIRAAGPALRAFAVGNALPDPILRVFANGLLVAENDDWNTPVAGLAAGSESITAAVAQTNAFPFSPGSRDAAVVAMLPPGAYSAVIEGVGGVTGAGLVEAYEVDRTAGKIVNVSTRGYAGRDDRELVGGFVVGGAVGATKRILIRVLGPTLARPPFNLTGTMDDPEFELRNAAGDLLLKSDDWSNAAEGGASAENDFKPVIALYGEKQIFATGLAPTNRREPCVLVDLPTGNYTVIVRPYELRSTNPLRDQPAVPGVGIVEVYEIDR
jgi:hypothetical protein